jgi:nicotinamidase-related amidase
VSRADEATLNPACTGLVVFDMLERYRSAIEEAGAIEPARTLIHECRERGVPVLYARADHREDGKDFATAVTDTDSQLRPWGHDNPRPTRPPHGSGSRELQVIAELAPRPGDYDVPKHRWSAFYQTHLDLSLRTRGIDTVMILGGSTHVGIASTVYAGRDMDYSMVVIRDACTGFNEQRDFFLERVFPRMCRVRSVAEAIAMLKAGTIDQEARRRS